MVVYQIDINYPSHVILTSLPLDRVLTESPAKVLCPHWLLLDWSLGVPFFLASGLHELISVVSIVLTQYHSPRWDPHRFISVCAVPVGASLLPVLTLFG